MSNVVDADCRGKARRLGERYADRYCAVTVELLDPAWWIVVVKSVVEI